jgi:hypothetical protein
MLSCAKDRLATVVARRDGGAAHLTGGRRETDERTRS